jgi:hypothetical protein
MEAFVTVWVVAYTVAIAEQQSVETDDTDTVLQ